MRRRALPLCALLALLTTGASVTAQAQDVLEQVAEARRAGDDAQALTLLEHAEQVSAARRAAERGLAYQGAGRFVQAERSLVEAMAFTTNPWIAAHRPSLALALRLTRERLGWLTVACAVPGTRALMLDDGARGFPCGAEQRVIVGTHRVEVQAPGQRSARTRVGVSPAQRARYTAPLVAIECASEGMLHVGGSDGTCCWPGQARSAEGGCEGSPSCPPNTRAEGATCQPTQRSARGLAAFHVGVFAGVAGFVSPDTSLFRPGVDSTGSSTQLGARLELRIGARLYGPLNAVVIVGGARQDVNRWLECGGADGSCVDTGPTAYGIDAGLMLQLHTDPRRRLGAFDVHFGLGVRPYARMRFDSSVAGQSSGKLTATVLPVEAGLSLYLGAAFSIDLVGQGELWLPREYCGEAPDGTRSCQGSASLEHEFGGSVLLGITLHLGG